MRLVMLISSRSNSKTTGVPEEAIVVDQVETPVEKITEWERLLRWAHASYGWNERGVARRTGKISRMRLGLPTVHGLCPPLMLSKCDRT